MTVPNPPPSSIEADERARKRAAIGLAPQRPTAKATPQRPPHVAGPQGCLWTLVLLVASLAVTTLLLVAARLVDSPTNWSHVRAEITSWFSGDRSSIPVFATGANREAGNYQRVLVDDFKADGGLLAANQQDGEWSLAMLREEGVYHMHIQPNRLAWSTVGANALTNFSLEVSLIVAEVTPAGYTGLIGRYQDRDNFYLFALDGRGQFQVQLLRAGELQTLIPWAESPWLNPAGQSNQVALVDNGQALRFYANGALLFSPTELQLPPGDAGIFGAAPPETMAEMDLDRLQLYALTKE